MEARRWALAFKKGPLTDEEREELAGYNQDLGMAKGQYREGMTEEEVQAILDKIREE